VLHACCHNPTGCDLDAEQWTQVIASARARGWIPVLDMAYQGFGLGLDEDATPVRRFVDAGIDCFVATSFSKNFSLYGERVGALSVVCADAQEAQRVLSQLKVLIRTNYSNPPTHGAEAVAAVLADPALRHLWEQELERMRERIRHMRVELIDRLKAAGVKRDMSFIGQQRGMFSYSGLSTEQMRRLRSEFGVYGVDSGRICVAALNERNLDHVVRAVAAVM
jgi:aromatic-amino-acid transaminase